MTHPIPAHPPLLLAACVVVLAVRPIGWGASLVTVAVGAVGAVSVVDATRVSSRLAWVAVVAIGLAGFVFVRMQTPMPPLRTTAFGIAASVAAAVAEELFFRRLLFARLEPWGPLAAVAGTAALFALVHTVGYGVGALPIDFAAGLVFGWQRWATGTWTAPAATHVVANLVQVLG
jgi:membrane protease YdiL (CAAX protease family)